MAVAGFKTCDFVTYNSKGIFIVTITFNDKFWETVVAAVHKFNCQQIVPSFLMEALPDDNFHTRVIPKTRRSTNSVNISSCFYSMLLTLCFFHIN